MSDVRQIVGRILDDGDEAAVADLSAILRASGVEFETIGWDDYDTSLELHGVPSAYRLAPEAQRMLRDAGFAKVYVNHVDKWETHHSLSGDVFKPNAWRVSYPHKRGDGETGIWVEADVPHWPRKWFATAYAIVKGFGA